MGLVLGPQVEAIIARAVKLGCPSLADRATVEMVLDGQPADYVKRWVAASNRELDEIPIDAEIVADAQEAPLSASPAQTPVPTHEADNASLAPAQAGEASETPDPARIEAMRRRALSLLDDADAFDAEGDDARATDVRGEAEALMAQVDAACDPSQDTLGF